MKFLSRISAALSEAGVTHALVGGHAVALHGAVRGTVDLDFVLQWTHDSLVSAECVLQELGLVSRVPVRAEEIYQFRDEYIREKNFIAWNFYNPQNLTEQVDIIIIYDLNYKDIVPVEIDKVVIPVLSKAELIKMKQQSGRPQDLLDIEALEKLK